MIIRQKIIAIGGTLPALLLCALLVAFISSPARADANFCYLENPFGGADSYAPFAVDRDGGARKHKGNDMFYCEGTQIPAQTAGNVGGQAGYCNVIPNSAGNPVWAHNSGYGLFMRFSCNDSLNIETRYAHIQGFNATSKTVINGRTGNAWTTPPHVHYEIYVQNKAIDPECALGVQDSKNTCPGLSSSQVNSEGKPNLCDPEVLRILHADASRKLSPTSSATKMGNQTSQPIESWQGGIYGDPCEIGQCSDPAKQCERVENPESPEYNHVHEGDLETIGEETTDGTGLRVGTGIDGEPGDPGGEQEEGTEHPDAEIPPVDDYDGEEQSSCAVDTQVAMTNQAVLQARRETIMNARFIAKPDSVLAYGCFLQKAGGPIVEDAADVFSETSIWKSKPIDIRGKQLTIEKELGKSSMDSAMQSVVYATILKYMTPNFNHPLMGGLNGYSETPSMSNCGDMAKVWQAAKCMNFDGSKDFLTFEQMIDNDPRQYPPSIVCNETKITQDMIDTAKGKYTKYDKPEMRYDYLLAEGACKDPIKTGLTIYRHKELTLEATAPETYDDAICTNIGCHYENTDMSGIGKCVKN